MSSTKEKHIVIKTPEELHNFITHTGIANINKLVNTMLENILLISKSMMFQDLTDVDNKIIIITRTLQDYGFVVNHNIDMVELRRVIINTATDFIEVLVMYHLDDYMIYIQDYNRSKIALRAFKLDRDIDVNKGVENDI